MKRKETGERRGGGACNHFLKWPLPIYQLLTLSPFLFIFSHPANFSRAFYFFASSLLSESLEQATCLMVNQVGPISAILILHPGGCLKVVRSYLYACWLCFWFAFQNERFNRFLRFFASLINNDGTLRKCYCVRRSHPKLVARKNQDFSRRTSK